MHFAKTRGADYLRIITRGHPELVEGSGWRAFSTSLLRQAQDDLWVWLSQNDFWVRLAQNDLWVRFADGRDSILQQKNRLQQKTRGADYLRIITRGHPEHVEGSSWRAFSTSLLRQAQDDLWVWLSQNDFWVRFADGRDSILQQKNRLQQKTRGADCLRIITRDHPELVEGSGWRAFSTSLLRQAQDDLWVWLSQNDFWVRLAQNDLWVRFADGRDSILQQKNRLQQKTRGADYLRIITRGHPEHVEGSSWRAFSTSLLRQAQDDLWVWLAQNDLWVRFAKGRDSILQYVL